TSLGITTTNGFTRNWDICHRPSMSGRWRQNHLSRCPELVDHCNPGDFEEFVQVASLCILMHRNDLLARFVFLTDRAGFKGEDTLYEDLLRKNLPGRADIDEWFHPVYSQLIRAIYAPDRSAASALLNEYCAQWYVSFGELQASWHDAHLSINGDDGSYFGYWAFEAGAIAFLYGIDDSQINQMIYPKDLVEYARKIAGQERQ
ncbi:PoNe immunity protein domain-containing protein, partial [Pseudomonas sp. PB103]|uniref:PoNe immunity protein domain-containing protein n=1 Tax=Pseudomonas sp. PB103 TaxID=2494698 RepID=UPI002113B6B0